MTNSPALICRPELISFHSTPIFGEVVFRLFSPPSSNARMELIDASGNSHLFKMAFESENTKYLALVLEPGDYLYRYLIDNKPMLDKSNCSPLTYYNGKLLNNIKVANNCHTLDLINLSKEDIMVNIEPNSPVVKTFPQRALIRGLDRQHVEVTPGTMDSIPGFYSTHVNIRRNKQIICKCKVNIRTVSNVPYLRTSFNRIIEEDLVLVRMEAFGTGAIRCYVLDRSFPKIEYIRFSSGYNWGWSEKCYRSGKYGTKLAQSLGATPAITLCSDSPFPDQRYKEYILE